MIKWKRAKYRKTRSEHPGEWKWRRNRRRKITCTWNEITNPRSNATHNQVHRHFLWIFYRTDEMYVTAKIISFYDFHGNHFKRVLWSKPIALTTCTDAIAGATLSLYSIVSKRAFVKTRANQKEKENHIRRHTKEGYMHNTLHCMTCVYRSIRTNGSSIEIHILSYL